MVAPSLSRGLTLSDRPVTAAFPGYTSTQLLYGHYLGTDSISQSGSTAFTGAHVHKVTAVYGYCHAKSVSLDNPAILIETASGRRQSQATRQPRTTAQYSFKNLTAAELEEFQHFFMCIVGSKQLISLTNEHGNTFRGRILGAFSWSFDPNTRRYNIAFTFSHEYTDRESTMFTGSQHEY